MGASSTARAENDGQATAESLFQRGTASMAAGDMAAACPLFLESYRIDRAGGTLQNLAFCYESTGRFASAYARYEELKTLASRATPPRKDRIDLANEHIAALEPKLSRLAVKPSQTPASDLTIVVDGTDYREVAWSVGIVLDPGDHQIVATAPGKKPWRTRVTVSAPGTLSLAIPALERDVTAPPKVASPDPHPTRRTGFVVGGIGLAVLATGGAFGLLASSAKPGACHGTNTSGLTPQYDTAGKCLAGSDAYNDWRKSYTQADMLANVANVLVPVGAVATAVGVYLVLRGPSNDEKRTGELRLVPAFSGARIEGTF
jgi:tetratricopeptide (TPR) repeat protein